MFNTPGKRGRKHAPDPRFHDLGPDHFDRQINTYQKKRNHIRQLEALGYRVTLEPAA